jgi:hypothetical protein
VDINFVVFPLSRMTNWNKLIFNAGVGESAENASGSPDQFSCHHRDWRWVIGDFVWVQMM